MPAGDRRPGRPFPTPRRDCAVFLWMDRSRGECATQRRLRQRSTAPVASVAPILDRWVTTADVRRELSGAPSRGLLGLTCSGALTETTVDRATRQCHLGAHIGAVTEGDGGSVDQPGSAATVGTVESGTESWPTAVTCIDRDLIAVRGYP